MLTFQKCSTIVVFTMVDFSFVPAVDDLVVVTTSVADSTVRSAVLANPHWIEPVDLKVTVLFSAAHPCILALCSAHRGNDVSKASRMEAAAVLVASSASKYLSV